MIHCKRCEYYVPPDKCSNEKGCKQTHMHCYCSYSKLKEEFSLTRKKVKAEEYGKK